MTHTTDRHVKSFSHGTLPLVETLPGRTMMSATPATAAAGALALRAASVPAAMSVAPAQANAVRAATGYVGMTITPVARPVPVAPAPKQTVTPARPTTEELAAERAHQLLAPAPVENWQEIVGRTLGPQAVSAEPAGPVFSFADLMPTFANGELIRGAAMGELTPIVIGQVVVNGVVMRGLHTENIDANGYLIPIDPKAPIKAPNFGTLVRAQLLLNPDWWNPFSARGFTEWPDGFYDYVDKAFAQMKATPLVTLRTEASQSPAYSGATPRTNLAAAPALQRDPVTIELKIYDHSPVGDEIRTDLTPKEYKTMSRFYSESRGAYDNALDFWKQLQNPRLTASQRPVLEGKVMTWLGKAVRAQEQADWIAYTIGGE